MSSWCCSGPQFQPRTTRGSSEKSSAGIVYDEKGYPFVQIYYGEHAAVSLNELLLKKGYARVDLKYLPAELKHYVDLENEARDKGLGIWKAGRE